MFMFLESRELKQSSYLEFQMAGGDVSAYVLRETRQEDVESL